MIENSSQLLSIGILGGTGKEGKSLARRWAQAGYRLYIGSRSPEKAHETALELADGLDGNANIQGMNNQDAAKRADIIVLTVPYTAHSAILESIRAFIQGKILIDVTVPFIATKTVSTWMPPAGSAAQEAREILGEEVQVCTAFQNVSYRNITDPAGIECEVLVTGSSEEARAETLKLVKAAGFTGWDAGPIENSYIIEGLTLVLIYINKQHKNAHAGIKITGVDIPR